MRALFLTVVAVVLAGPALAQQASDNPTWIPGQTRSFLTLYDQTGLNGQGVIFTERTGNLTDAFRARSLRTSGGPWEVCDGANYSGRCVVAEGWTFNLNDVGLRRVRSIRPVDPDAPRT